MKKIEIKWGLKTILLLVNIGLLLIIAFFGRMSANRCKKYYSQQMATRWESKDNSYAQVTGFLSSKRNVQEDGIAGIRSSLQETLVKDSLHESKGASRVWVDAFSGETTTTLWREKTTQQVRAVGVGGDFFQFHPFPLKSGSYFTPEDLNPDRIVVDENFAWNMFGSNDIVGMQVWLQDKIYTIAGVVGVEEDSLYRATYGERSRVYFPYQELKEQCPDLQITCYEAVLPNPITNYAKNALSAACGLGEGEEEGEKKDTPLCFEEVEVIENSNRYKPAPLLHGLSLRKYEMMRTNSVVYPFWENLARREEHTQQMLLILRLLLLVCPVLCVIIWIYDAWSHKTWTVKSIINNQIDRMREKQEQKREARRRELEEETELENSAQEKDCLQSVTEENIFKM